MIKVSRPMRFGTLAVSAVLLGSPLAPAQAVEDFYKGRQMTLVVGSGTGGGYDAQARLVSRHMGRHIPGTPSIIVQNMPGAGSLQATNHLYNIAPKDGSMIGAVQRGMLTARLTNPDGVRFDAEKFNWIGNLASEIAATVVWHTAPHHSFEDLLKEELIVGGTGPTIDTETTPRLYNRLLGTRFRIISGYTGTAEILLAMERGEVQGLGDWSWSNVKTRSPDFLENNLIRVLVQGGLEKAPDLPDVPLALDLVKDEEDRKVMELFFVQKSVARPYLAPPGVPSERVSVLRAAFMAMADDPDFLADAEKSRLELDLAPGDFVQETVERIAGTPPEIADRLKEAIAP